MTSGELHNLSELHFPLLSNGNNDSDVLCSCQPKPCDDTDRAAQPDQHLSGDALIGEQLLSPLSWLLRGRNRALPLPLLPEMSSDDGADG